ncbi:hypothetical protein BS78_01G059200 [Paspalum vaginatum]|nr:hypothetical protein BS78_01G059200 [Paspalum vaginatum]
MHAEILSYLQIYKSWQIDSHSRKVHVWPMHLPTQAWNPKQQGGEDIALMSELQLAGVDAWMVMVPSSCHLALSTDECEQWCAGGWWRLVVVVTAWRLELLPCTSSSSLDLVTPLLFTCSVTDLYNVYVSTGKKLDPALVPLWLNCACSVKALVTRDSSRTGVNERTSSEQSCRNSTTQYCL